MSVSHPLAQLPSQFRKFVSHVPTHDPPAQRGLVAWTTEVHGALHAPQCALSARRLVHALLPIVHIAPLGPHPSVHTPITLQVRPKQQGALSLIHI